jgi:predicted phosphodiesterase
MRYAVISDIHSNFEALRAVIDALAKENIDKYLCLGDVVGYGADPIACMNLLKTLKPEILIAGNHDWGVLGQTDIEYFNDAAKAAIEWTKGLIKKDEAEYLRSFKLIYEGVKFVLVHGSINSPDEFNYILNDYDAYRTVKLMKVPLCFVGHSHVAGIFYSDERVRYLTAMDVKISPEKKYIVNVGSVGQPRDGDPRASYAIYDETEGSIEIKRVEYDIKTCQKKIIAAGLPNILAIRLSQGR